MPEPKQAYLGDGAYVEVNQFGELVVYTSNGLTRQNEVVLERAPAQLLVRFIEEHQGELIG